MNKRIIISILLVYLCWFVLDFLLHSVILAGAYESTAYLWRPMAEIKIGLMQVVSIITAASFVLVYTLWFKEYNVATGLKYGLVFGLGYGVSMGYGTYSVVPIPYWMAFAWCFGTLLECVVAGLVIGLLVKKPEQI